MPDVSVMDRLEDKRKRMTRVNPWNRTCLAVACSRGLDVHDIIRVEAFVIIVRFNIPGPGVVGDSCLMLDFQVGHDRKEYRMIYHVNI